jgi:hypothetical protein
MEKQSTLTEVQTVSVNDAITETANWRQILTPFMKDPIRGFFIPIADVKAIAEMHHVEGMRGYFCLKTPDDFSSISFVVVPVDDHNKDIIFTHNELTGKEDPAIYDLTRPCPDFCDTTSPLY